MRRRVVLVLAVFVIADVSIAVLVTARKHDDGRAAALRILDAVPKSGSYSAAGRYVDPLESNIDPPAIILAEDGLPIVKYDIGYRANPVTTAQYGLWAFGAYLRDHRQDNRDTFLRAARRLVATQTSNGRWLYDFDLQYDSMSLAAPWASAMAQGQAMSLLERAFRLTGQRSYLDAALRALQPLRINVAKGGLQRCFLGDCRRPWFEEAPTTPPSYVLNGFMFTLIGLYDLASVAPQSDAPGLYLAGRRTLEDALPHYDVDGRATYDLTHETVGSPPKIANPSYQAVHVYLLRALAWLRADGLLSRYAARWQSNLR